MFKKISVNSQYDMFSTASTQMSKRAAKKYDDPGAWHNQFYTNVTSKIDEAIFAPLFKQDRGILLLNSRLRKQVLLFLEEDAQEMVYRLNSETLGEKISSLGELIYQVLKRLTETTAGYDLLHRVFHEQYEVVKGRTILRPKEDITARNVQTHNDPDTDYRKKGDQKVDGQIATAELRRELSAIPGQEQMKRNNVEETIFQYCFHTRNNKTRYRGLFRHKLFTFARCLWINHLRLGNYLITIGQRAHENGLITDFCYIKTSIMEQFFIVFDFLLPRSSETKNEKKMNYVFNLKLTLFKMDSSFHC